MKCPDRLSNESGQVERAPTSCHTKEQLIALATNYAGNDAANQRKRLLAALMAMGSVTTIEARRHLDIMSPAPRIMELRKQGKAIATQWVRQATECGRVHRVGLYVLEANV